MGLDVLVVGGGGREHALVSGLARSPRIGRIVCVPGNPGIGRHADLVSVAADDVPGIVEVALRRRVGLAVIGPEAPLVAGLADVLRGQGIAVFGPGRDGARIEGSKAFAKQIMQSAGVPTARAALFDRYEPALEYLRAEGAPIVVKADGLAAGKGVMVCATMEEAETALQECFVEKRFGSAGAAVLLEEYLEGEEVSLLAVVSGDQILPLSPAQDYKRVFDQDQGPNTGGMGSYSPVPAMTAELSAEAVRTVLRPTVAELAARGIDYRGVLYAGLMLTPGGPKVLEFNCRFGDPETQALIPRLRTDLVDLLEAAARGDALPAAADWTDGPAVGVVMASRGYPESSSKGDVIRGLEEAEQVPGVQVFHAGTARQEADIVTAGGRVLAVTAIGDSFSEARARAYEAVGKISFDGRQYRTDIALRAELRESASSRGRVTSLSAGGAAGPGPGRAEASGRPAAEQAVWVNERNGQCTQPVVGIVMGSESDREVMEAAGKELDARGIPSETSVISAHRDPDGVREYSLSAEGRGLRVIIAGAGKAAALPGVIASMTDLPVIGVPIKTSDLGGLDSLLSIVQMPPGVPVACMAINGARNAAILAAKILRLADAAQPSIAEVVARGGDQP